jgi:hypothetical protein
MLSHEMPSHDTLGDDKVETTKDQEEKDQP